MGQASDIPLEQIDLPILKLLLDMTRSESLSQAAAAQKMSASKASRMLSKARVLFGDQLFIRSSAQMLPTKRMLQLVPKIESLFEILGVLFLRQEALNIGAVAEQVCIAASDHAFQVCVAPFLESINSAAPMLSFNVKMPSTDTLEAMRRGEVDFLIVQDPKLRLSSESFHVETLLDSPHGLLLSKDHPLLRALHKAAADPEECVNVLRGSSMVGNPLQLPSGLSRDMTTPLSDAPINWVKLPYFVGSALLVAKSAKIMLTTEAFAKTAVSTMPLAFVRLPWVSHWRPRIVWHERTNLSPLHQWLRGKIRLGIEQAYSDLQVRESSAAML